MVKATVVDAIPRGDHLVVALSARTALEVDVVVNCTGAAGVCERTGGQLVDRLFDSRLVRPHQLALGVEVDSRGQAVGRRGAVRPGLHVVGPLRRGVFWETTAMPEIAVQASDTAGAILAAAPQARVALVDAR